MDHPRGLELLFNLFQDDLSSKEDILTIVVHNLIINKLGLFVGLGDEWPDDEKGTELLSKGWNSNKNLYTLRYMSVDASKKYLVKAAKTGDDLLLTILEIVSKNVQCLTFNINSYVIEITKDFSKAYQNLSEMSKKFDDMIAHFQDKSSKNSDEESKEKKCNKEEPYYLPERNKVQDMLYEQRRGFPVVGQSDLDPFAGGMSGGMLLDPRDRQRGIFPNPHLPRGAVPPGARFDPMGPLFGRHGQQPDPDHLPPPGYDDMFM